MSGTAGLGDGAPRAAIKVKPASGGRSSAKLWADAAQACARLLNDPRASLAKAVEAVADRSGERPALLSDEEAYSYAELAARVRRYARWALEHPAGSCVALLLEGRPEYLAAWLGVTRAGRVAALISPNLAPASLAQALARVDPVRVIVSEAALEAAVEALAVLGHRAEVWLLESPAAAAPRLEAQRLGPRLDGLSAEPLSLEACPGAAVDADALLIFTSGTTGFPKAARLSHRRMLTWCGVMAGLTQAGPDDRLYDCLPLHHSVGGVAAPGALLASGGSIAIRPRFSAAAFWPDVERWNCTVFQYIGELARYLCAAPPHAAETRHTLRLACGAGLTAEVWSAFQARFKVPRILEFYASTEGNFSLYNLAQVPGALGRPPPAPGEADRVALIRYDAERDAPLRTHDGLALPCSADESGEAIARMASDPARAGFFAGYTEAQESEKKVLRDVFEIGDRWFRSGDLMRRSAEGDFYFVDRVGDTFRWKGENVSAAETADALQGCSGVRQAAVYGVAVAGADGRAGMAAIVVEADLDWVLLRREIAARLPSHARPLFVRLTPALAATDTFRARTLTLKREGYDLDRVAEPIFFDDRSAGRFVRLDAALLAQIKSGDLRL